LTHRRINGKVEIRSRAKKWCIERSLTKEAASFWLKKPKQGNAEPYAKRGLIAEVHAKVG
jgi:hypothetical protein